MISAYIHQQINTSKTADIIDQEKRTKDAKELEAALTIQST